jgi:hypothetical protein
MQNYGFEKNEKTTLPHRNAHIFGNFSIECSGHHTL